jgi:hypothetical protein
MFRLFFISTAYIETVGECRGGQLWPSGEEYECTKTKKTRTECERACTANSDCAAFDMHSTSENENCCLFKEGGTGNGGSAKKCFLKIPGIFLMENISL